jgi:prephenate dehydrogenase
MATITIIGTGLIGSSMGMALRKNGHFIIGCDKSTENLEHAKRIGAIDISSKYTKEIVEKSEVVILATPVDTIEYILPKLLDDIATDTTVIDTGSTKLSICKTVHNHSKRRNLVASHPMAGSEKSGSSGASSNLFENKKVVICESGLSSGKSLQTALNLFKELQMQPIFLSPQEHDSMVGLVSHIPQLIAYAFASMRELNQAKNDGWEDIASNGFESVSRLGLSSPDVWLPILLQNKENLIKNLRSLNQNIELIMSSLSKNDTDTLRSIMKKAVSARSRFNFSKNQLNKSNELTLQLK